MFEWLKWWWSGSPAFTAHAGPEQILALPPPAGYRLSAKPDDEEEDPVPEMTARERTLSIRTRPNGSVIPDKDIVTPKGLLVWGQVLEAWEVVDPSSYGHRNHVLLRTRAKNYVLIYEKNLSNSTKPKIWVWTGKVTDAEASAQLLASSGYDLPDDLKTKLKVL